MLLELAKPLSMMLSIFSLYAVFYSAFLMPAVSWEQRIWFSLELLSLAAAVCLLSGLIVRVPPEPSRDEAEVEWRIWRDHWSRTDGWDEGAGMTEVPGPEPLFRTLPVQMFCWASCLMAGLFVLSWYLETYFVLYRDTRRW